MAVSLYTYSNYLSPYMETNDGVYPLSLIRDFVPVSREKKQEIIDILVEGKYIIGS